MNAKWTDGKMYSAQIMAHTVNGTYDVYFPDDGEVLYGVSPCDVRGPLVKPTLTRDDTVGRKFFDDGGELFLEGTWVVESVDSDNPSEFKCRRLTGGEDVGEIVNFDVGHVMRMVKQTEKESNML